MRTAYRLVSMQHQSAKDVASLHTLDFLLRVKIRAQHTFQAMLEGALGECAAVPLEMAVRLDEREITTITALCVGLNPQHARVMCVDVGRVAGLVQQVLLVVNYVIRPEGLAQEVEHDIAVSEYWS